MATKRLSEAQNAIGEMALNAKADDRHEEAAELVEIAAETIKLQRRLAKIIRGKQTP